MNITNRELNVDKLLSSLDKKQIEAFIRKECASDVRFCDRFLALGMGTLFTISPSVYSSRITDLIEDYGGKYGYVKYRDTFDFNRAVSRIYDEFNAAVESRRWEVAVSVLAGISEEADDILNCGDDSAGELGSIVDECFEKWMELVAFELPDDVANHIFNLALDKFKKKHLKSWDWWWSWIEIAIELAHTSDRQKMVLAALDEIKQPVDDNWSDVDAYDQARSYKMKMMARCGTPEEQRKYMYENIDNPDFRRNILQTAWEEENVDEVLRLAKEGIAHDSQYADLVWEWKEWEMRVYMKKDDVPNILRLAKEFFLCGSRGGFGKPNDFSMEEMYSLIKSKVDTDLWPEWQEGLIRDASKSKYQLLYIFTQEKLWDRYMDYLKSNPTRYLLEEAPSAVRNLNKEEFIQLYAGCIEAHFKHASNRDAYRDGAFMLKKLIKYGGHEEAKMIIEHQKERRPRRPALIDELSKIQ